MEYLIHLTYSVESKHDERTLQDHENLEMGKILGSNLKRISVEVV